MLKKLGLIVCSSLLNNCSHALVRFRNRTVFIGPNTAVCTCQQTV